jgi:hypothetical protein
MLNFIKSILNFTISFLYKSKDHVFLLNNKPTTQYLQDPTLPDLKVKIALTPPKFSNFNVINLTSTGNAVNTLVWQSENVYANINSSLGFMKKYFPVNIKNWAATTNLLVYPRAGNDANAYYDRASIRFFYFKGNSNKIIYTCDSADIITHELGHAILDAIRPDFWNIAAFEIGAFHESFGDIYAILTALNYNLVLNKVLAVTKNDLKKENIVSDLAEQFGRSLGIGNSLRDAYNSYSYVNPITLPTSRIPPDSGLIQEVHSFSQVFTGVFYELFTEFYELFGKNKAGLIRARDLSAEFIFNAIKTTPATEKFFMAIANNYLAYSLSKYAGSYTAILTKVFTKRNLMPIPLIKKLSNSNFDIMSEYEDNILFKEEKIMVLNCEEIGVEEICGFKSINVQIAADSFKTKSGMLNILSVNHNEEESKNSAKDFVKYLINNKEIGNDKQSWFVDENTNSLTRRHACCGFGFINNCTIEGQPEHGKCWKSENNSGCCPYGCQSTSMDVTPVKPNCSIAYNNCSGNSYRVCNSFKRV